MMFSQHVKNYYGPKISYRKLQEVEIRRMSNLKKADELPVVPPRRGSAENFRQ